ncbi:MAG TPA: AAA family ATPase [Tepidisphaeraceae bacterium]
MRTEGHELTADAEALREQLRHVYWIGGGSGAGKSTIARRIAAEHDLQHYATDDVMPDHAKRSTPEDCPLLHKFMAMDMDQRWVNRAPKEMLETFHWFRGEGFQLIIEDLLRLAKKPGVVADGFRLLPHLVKPLLGALTHAVWLIPTPEFRRTVFDSRGMTQSGFIAKTSDPGRAQRNLLERDTMFTRGLHEEAKRLGLKTIEVDTTMTVDDLAGRVAEAFGL